MNSRERQLAILNHESPDRIPWVPRLLPWYNSRIANNSMPSKWEGLSLREIERDLGCGTPAKAGRLSRRRFDGVEVVHREEDGQHITEFQTPVGTVRQVTGHSETLAGHGLGGRVNEQLLKGPDDYRVWEWVEQHTYWDPIYDEFLAYDAEIGGDGLPMLQVGDAPFHWFLLHGAGYNHGYLQLNDYTREVEHLLAVMTEVQRERHWPVLANSPARLILHGVHHSSAFTPPPYYEKYILPYYQQMMPLMHEHGKSVTLHADNDTSLIAELIEQAGYDMVECFVTSPMVPFTLEQARETWGTRIIIFGGLPSLLMSPTISEQEFRDYVYGIFKTIAPGDAFILGVADNVMPDSVIDRIAWVSEVIEERGWYPTG